MKTVESRAGMRHTAKHLKGHTRKLQYEINKITQANHVRDLTNDCGE
jgi:rubrerythrin